MAKVGQARLPTSVWMACRPRHDTVGEFFLGDLLDEMRTEIRDLWARADEAMREVMAYETVIASVERGAIEVSANESRTFRAVRRRSSKACARAS